GDVFIADTNNSRVVEVPAGGGAQTTVGSGLSSPDGAAVDAAGDVFIADTNNSRVVEVPAGGGAQTTVDAGLNGPNGPFDVAVDARGDVFISDIGNNRVVEVPAGGGTQTTVGTGLSLPLGVAAYAPPPTFIADTPPAAATVGSSYSYTYTAATPVGEPAATFAVSGGTLPPGLTLNATTGVISGTPRTAGTYTFTAETENAANGTLGPSTTITVARAAQTITFTSAPPPGAVVGGPSYTVTATGGRSGNPVTFTSGSPAVCTVSGSTVTFTGAGTCVIDADQAGDTNHSPAAQAQQSVTVAKAAQTITFTSTPPTDATVGGASYTVTATGGASGNPVTFTSGSPNICTVSGSTVSFLGAGTCVIDANQAGDANHTAAAQAQQSVAVGKAAQAINFTSTPPTDATVGGASYTVTATGGPSGNPVTFTSGSPNICTVSGSTVSFLGAGTCVIDANQAGDANHTAAAQMQQIVAVAKAAQTITFTSTPPTDATVGGASYTVTATGGPSGIPVTFASGSPSVCTVSGSTVTFTGAGTCVIDANQAGDANHTPAAQAQQSVAVAKAAQAITFTSAPPAAAVVGGPSYTVTATGGASANPVTFTSGSPAVCSVSGSTVSFTGPGTCVIDANQAGAVNYTAAAQASQTITVGKGSQTITFTSTPPADATVGGPSYTVTATGGASDMPVVFTSGSPTVCSVSGSTVTFASAGTCAIHADQAGTVNYTAAAQVSQTVTVNAATPVPTTPPAAAAPPPGPSGASTPPGQPAALSPPASTSNGPLAFTGLSARPLILAAVALVLLGVDLIVLAGWRRHRMPRRTPNR
ncbi:MAG: putative Ig domain-containing protein, partial [Acidimicrobiales bacterium]